MKHHYIKLLLLFLLLDTAAFAQVKEWKQMPLRSASQKAAGLMGGEGMQMIQGIAYAPSNPRIVYLASDTSQVWKSIDGGDTWQMKHKGFHAKGGLSVVVDPHNENIVLVAGSIGKSKERVKPGLSPLSGIFRTTDGGENWNLIKEIAYFGDHEGTHFAFNPASFDGVKTRVIYAGTYQDGLLKSVDAGGTWTSVGLGNIKITDVWIDPKEPSRVYLAARDGLYRYDDQEGNMDKIGLGLPDFPRTIAINPVKTNIIYAAVGNYGVYWSIDGGNNFVSRNRGLPISKKEYIHLSLSPANPEYIYVSINRSSILNPFWSHDGGASWYKPKTLDKGKLSLMGERRYSSGPIEPHPKDSEIALTAANGAARILKTDDGGITWFYSGHGYTGSRMGGGKNSLAFYSDPGKMAFFLIDFGLAVTEDGGKTFRLLPIPRVLNGKTTPVGAVDPTGKSKLIVTAVGKWHRQLLAVSEDGGGTWRVIPGTEDSYKFIAFHPQRPEIIYAQGWKSEDSGKTWKQLPRRVRAIYPDNGDIVYSVDSLGKGKSTIFKSSDAGQRWTSPFGSLPISARAIREIDIDPSNPNRIYVASNKGLYIYSKGHWVRKGEESGLSKDRFGLLAVKCVVVDPRHPEVVYAGRWAPGKGHSNGIFRSTDFGESWENISYNLGPEITCWSVSVSPHDGTVYFGSSHGTWVLPPPY